MIRQWLHKWYLELQRLNTTLEWLHNEGINMTQATDNLATANTRLAASVAKAAEALRAGVADKAALEAKINDLTAQLAAVPTTPDTDPQVQAEADAVNAQADALDAAVAPPAA